MRLMVRFALFCVLLAACTTGRAAIVIGPGNIENNFNDVVPYLIAVDLANSQTLAAGHYTADTFNYQFWAAIQGAFLGGSITPFLSLSDGAGNFVVIALGDKVTFAGVTDFISKPFGGSASFSLASDQTVYAGVYWDATGILGEPDMPIGFDDSSGSSYIRYSVGTAGPALGEPLSGGTVLPDTRRRYDFSITVSPAASVPEPSTLALAGVAGLAGLGAGWRRCRRRKVA